MPYARNARTHSPEQISQIAGSIREWGWTIPVLIDPEGTILAGHARVLAAQQLGFEDVPCVVAHGWSEAQRRAYVIADNRLATNAGWDEELLAAEFEALRDFGFDLELTGFDLAELDGFGEESAPLAADDVVEPPPVHPVTQMGDLWLVGDHRILCGSSTNGADVARVLAGERAKLLSTDPPYCVDYTGQDRPVHEGRPSGKDWSHLYREVDIDDLGEFMDGVFAAVLPHVEESAAVYVWHAHVQQPVIAACFERHGLLLHQILVWVKPVATFGHCYYRWRHEPCAFGWRRGHKPDHGAQQLETVWELDWEGKSRIVGNEHPTQKPLRVFEIPMEQHTSPGDVVLEPFSGSGSQLVAAHRLGRKCRAIELQPAFVDVALRRMQRLFPEVPITLEATGQTLAQVSLERGVQLNP